MEEIMFELLVKIKIRKEKEMGKKLDNSFNCVRMAR